MSLLSIIAPLSALVLWGVYRVLRLFPKFDHEKFAEDRVDGDTDLTDSHARTVREMIRHENDVINHRLSWLLAVEGFLFAGLGFAWKLQDINLVTVIALTGATIAMFTFPVLSGAHNAIRQMAEWWIKNRPESLKKEPDVIGYRQNLMPIKWLPTWYTLPIIVILAWSAILHVNLNRSPKTVDTNREPVVIEVVYPKIDAPSGNVPASSAPDGSP